MSFTVEGLDKEGPRRFESSATGTRRFAGGCSLSDLSAPLYSKLGTREGFAHWTTTHQPPRKRLVGKKQPFSYSKPPSSFSFSLPHSLFPEVTHPPPPAPKSDARRTQRESARTKSKRDGDGNSGGRRGPGSWGGWSRRGPGSSRLGLRHRIGRLFQPLAMLRMVTVLFLNVTYNVTMDTFSLPRHVFIVARLLWPSAMRKVEGGGGGGGRRGGRRGRGAGGKERGDGSGKDGKGGGTGMHLKTRMQDSLKDLSKSSKKWSGMLSRSVGGMRRGFSSSENLLQHRRIDHLVMQGKRCDAVCDSSGAVDAFRTAIALRPDDPELLVSLAKSLSDRIFEKDIFNNLPLARAICLEAAEISRRAITLKPCHAEAHLCLGAALGRLAMWSDNREKVDLSRAIKDECEEAIRLDAVNDLAMHVLGRYEHQMAGLGRIVRTLVRVVYGGALAPGTLQEAENLFRRAIAIRPRRLIHRVELGKLLIDRGRKDEALIELELAVTLPREDINSEHERADAQELLKKHWGKVAVIPTFEDPPPTPPLRMPRRSADRSRVSLDALDQPGKST